MRCLSRLALAAALAAVAAAALADDGTPERRGYTAVRGSRIQMEAFGNGTPLAFLHGGPLGFDHSFAKHYFGSRGKVIGIDRPGHDHRPDNGRSCTRRETARGDRDFTPIEETVAICRSQPDDQLPIVAGTGPMAFSDRTELTNLAIAKFLGQP